MHLEVSMWPDLLFAAAAVLKLVQVQNISQKILSPLQVPQLQNGAVTFPQLKAERIWNDMQFLQIYSWSEGSGVEGATCIIHFIIF